MAEIPATSNGSTPPPSVKNLPPRPRVVIVGGGFAGLTAGMALGNMAVDVTLLDRRNHHTFQPLLYQVALAVLSPADIAQPIRSIFSKKRNVQVLMDEVENIEANDRRVVLGSGVEPRIRQERGRAGRGPLGVHPGEHLGAPPLQIAQRRRLPGERLDLATGQDKGVDG